MAKKVKVMQNNHKKYWLIAGVSLLILFAVVFLYKSEFFYKAGFGSDNQARTAAIAYCARLVENSSWQANQIRDQFLNGSLDSGQALSKLTELREQLAKTEAFFATTKPIPQGYEGPANNVKSSMDRYATYLASLEKFLNASGNPAELNKMAVDTLWDSMAASVFFEKEQIEANAIQGKVLINGQLYNTTFKVFRGY